MRILLPTIKKEFNEQTNQVEVVKSTLPVDIDTSFKAHLKWEENFQEVMHCDLTTYTERLYSIINDKDDKDKSKAKSQFLSCLKLLYCYVDSPELPTFKDFCQLFDYDIADKILEKIGIVLDETKKFVAKN